MSNSVRVSAPGKINIFFAVGQLREDAYHDVASVYQALNLREEIEVAVADEWQVEVSGQVSADQLASVPQNDSNLAIRAAKLIAREAGIEEPTPLKIQITKNVPVAGGMGGGSADAAAALLAVDELWCTGVAGEKIWKAATELGADVPFALIGGTAIGTGKGEELQAINGVKKFHWVLVVSNDGLSTPSVYQKLDAIRAERGENIRAPRNLDVPIQLIEALQSGDAHQLAASLRNDLQEAAIAMRPELGELINLGVAAGALAGMVSGSGPTVAFLVADAPAAQAVANKLAVGGYRAITTHGPAVGTILEG